MTVYPGAYTGVHGVVTVAGGGEEFIEVDINVTRGVAAQKRGGKYSELKVPGGFDVAISLRKILSDGAFFGRIINGTPITGSATVLLAATTITAGTAVAITSDPATPSLVKLTTSTAATTLAGAIVITGKDVNDAECSETFIIPAGTLSGTSFTGQVIFKETNLALPIDLTSTGGAKFQLDGVVAASAYTVGDPSIFNFVGKWDKGTPEIVFTCNNCFLTSAKTGGGDPNSQIVGDYNIVMQDADADFSMDYVTA
jgi:hypothetical protein